MIKPSYTEGFWNKSTYAQFIEKHSHLEFFKFATEEQKIAEFEKATGKTYKVENDAEKVAVKKPIK